MLFDQHELIGLQEAWKGLSENDRARSNQWRPEWDNDFAELAASFDLAFTQNNSDAWRNFCMLCRNLRLSIQSADAHHDMFLYTELASFSDRVENKLLKAVVRPQNIIPNVERDELIERLSDTEAVIKSSYNSDPLGRSDKSELEKAREVIARGRSEIKLTINLINIDASSVVSIVRDTLQAIKAGLDILYDEKWNDKIKNSARRLWKAAAKFTKKTRRLFSKNKISWSSDVNTDYFGEEEPKFKANLPTQSAQIEWYLARDGQQHGPLSDDELYKFIELGHLRPNDLVWRAGFTDWRTAIECFPNISQEQAAPSLPELSKLPRGLAASLGRLAGLSEAQIEEVTQTSRKKSN